MKNIFRTAPTGTRLPTGRHNSPVPSERAKASYSNGCSCKTTPKAKKPTKSQDIEHIIYTEESFACGMIHHPEAEPTPEKILINNHWYVKGPKQKWSD